MLRAVATGGRDARCYNRRAAELRPWPGEVARHRCATWLGVAIGFGVVVVGVRWNCVYGLVKLRGIDVLHGWVLQQASV